MPGHEIVGQVVAVGTFQAQEMVRLRRTLREQFCYLLNSGCRYPGRTMAAAHKDVCIQQADMAALEARADAPRRGAALRHGLDGGDAAGYRPRATTEDRSP